MNLGDLVSWNSALCEWVALVMVVWKSMTILTQLISAAVPTT